SLVKGFRLRLRLMPVRRVRMPFLRNAILLSVCLHASAQQLKTPVAPDAPDPYEQERKAYDEIYSTQRDMFSAEPNAFMVRTIAGRKPGRALDVAMGQGRNALWLAAHGWSVTGFDISPVAVAEARKEAAKRGLPIEILLTPYEQFAWGTEKWDLIL